MSHSPGQILGCAYTICSYGHIPFSYTIPVEFVCVILKNRYWVVHKPFVFIVKFEFLAQFPVDYLAHPVVSSIILFLC